MPSLILSVALSLPASVVALLSGMEPANALGFYVSTGIAVTLVSAAFRAIGNGAGRPTA